MRHQVYSDDIFFRKAVTALLPDHSEGPEHTIIDVQSLTSLEMLEVLLLCCQSAPESKVTLVGGGCLYSRVLASLTDLDKNAPVQTYRQHLAHTADMLYHHSVLTSVRELRELKRLTRAERHVADVLRRHPDISISRVAEAMQRQPKSIYHHARRAGNKLNLRNLQEFRQFLQYEFKSGQEGLRCKE